MQMYSALSERCTQKGSVKLYFSRILVGAEIIAILSDNASLILYTRNVVQSQYSFLVAELKIIRDAYSHIK